MSAKYKFDIIDGAVSYYLGVQSAIPHPSIPGYYALGKDIIQTESHAYNQIKYNLGIVRSLLTGVSMLTQVSLSPSGKYKTVKGGASNSYSVTTPTDIANYVITTKLNSNDVSVSDGTNTALESDLAQLYEVDFYKNNAYQYNKSALVGNTVGDNNIKIQTSYHAGGQAWQGLPESGYQWTSNDTGVKNVGGTSTLSDYGSVDSSKLKSNTIPTCQLSTNGANTGVTTNVTYDSVCYSMSNTKFKAYMANDDDQFGFMYILKPTGDSSNPSQFSNYVDGEYNDLTSDEKALILLTSQNEEELQIGSDYLIVAKITPSSYTLPNKVYSDIQDIAYFYRGGASQDYTDVENIKAHYSPYNKPLNTNDSNADTMATMSLYDYSNATVKALPVVFGFKESDSNPHLIYQFSNFKNFKDNGFSINGSNDGLAGRGYGKPSFKPFKSSTDSINYTNDDVISQIAVRYPQLKKASIDYMDDIMNILTTAVAAGNIAEDPDSEILYPAELNGGNLMSTNIKMKGQSASLIGIPNSTGTQLTDNNIVATLELGSSMISATLAPKRDSGFTVNTGAYFKFNGGSVPIVDLYCSLALVNGNGTPSAYNNMCAYHYSGNLHYTSNAYYRGFDTNKVQKRSKDMKSMEAGSYANQDPSIGDFSDFKTTYVKMVIPYTSGGPCAANLNIKGGGKDYSINGNGNVFNYNEADLPNSPGQIQPGLPTNPSIPDTGDTGLVFIKS